MKKMYSMLIVICMLFVPVTVSAASFDGSQPLLCALMKAMVCTQINECEEFSAEDLNVQQFVQIDFTKKEMRGVGDTEKKSSIERMETVDGKLILQGAEDAIEGVKDGVGWTMAIMEDTGKAVLTAAGDDVAFVLFGACIPK
jgi:hypothetical protein